MIRQKIRIFTFLYIMVSSVSSNIVWPNIRFSFSKGQLYIAGFFPVHRVGSGKTCGQIEEEGLQQLETFLFTVNEINKNKSFLPGIKLGVLGFDTCYSSSHTLEVAMEYIRILTDAERSQQQCRIGSAGRLIGLVGARSSDVSLQLANLMRIFKIPQVSYKASSPFLSHKTLYENFFRTVPSLNYQVAGIIEIIKSMGWTYVSVIYSNSHYGNAGFEHLQVLAANKSICFATVQRVHQSNFQDCHYDDVILALSNVTATAVVLFAEPLIVKQVIAAAKRTGIRNRFVWLGSEAWSSRQIPVEGQEEFAEGSLCVAYFNQPAPKVYSYFKGLTPNNSEATNPWFYEFWEWKKQCRLPNFPATPYNQNYTENCTGTIPEEKYMTEMPSAQLVRDAVYSIAHAIKNIHQIKCQKKRGMCSLMEEEIGKQIGKYLLNVTFQSGNENLFQFDSNGDAFPHFNIVNFQRDENGKYYWKRVGSYIRNKFGSLIVNLNKTLIRFNHHTKEFPDSVCSVPCSPSETKIISDSMKCCWTCINCTTREFVSKEGKCEKCDEGYIPNRNKSFCEEIRESYLNYMHPWAIGCLIFATLGILVTAAVSVIFWKYWETPVIKASARELSALLLLGIFLSFGLTFLIVKKPSREFCVLVRFFLGFNYTVCYAAIVVKTRRIACIFERRARNRSPRYTSPRSQLLIVAALVSVEVIIGATFVKDSSLTEHVYPPNGKRILICGGSNMPSYLLGLLYPFLLMILCTVYAFKTRKCPDGFNEAKHITFTNYITCVIWIAFLPSFTYSRNDYMRTITLSLLLSFSGIVQLACLFLPKVYIAIIRPQKNTKDLVMGPVSGTASTTTSN